MPKKSKEQKIRADVRRPTFQYTAQLPIKTFEGAPVQTAELTAIKKDLTKTALLATIAIISEFIIYWFERR